MTRSPEERLRDIQDCIRKARNADQHLQQAVAAGDVAAMETAHAAVERNLFVIGEAVKGLPDDVLALAPRIDWRAAKGLRDVLGHEYFRIDAPVVHATVREQLEPLDEAVRSILAALSGRTLGD